MSSDNMLECPCGCIMWVQDGKFHVKPCSPDCPNFHYALEETRRQGKAIEFEVQKREDGGIAS